MLLNIFIFLVEQLRHAYKSNENLPELKKTSLSRTVVCLKLRRLNHFWKSLIDFKKMSQAILQI